MDNDNSLQPADTRHKVLHDDIARRAQELWERYGRPHDRDLEIWLEAERQLLGADSSVKSVGNASVSSKQLGESTRAASQSAASPQHTGSAPSPEEIKIPSSESVGRSSPARSPRTRKSGGR
jgi:hypothetical protein